MARCWYSHKHEAWVKQCSCCQDLFVGVKALEESFNVFLEYFGESNGSAQTADGLQSRCRACNQSKRRALGIGNKELVSLWESQEGKCGICEKEISIVRGAGNAAHVDHEEETNKVRGLLCGNCNRGIGCMAHSTERLQTAIDYLKRFEEAEDE